MEAPFTLMMARLMANDSYLSFKQIDPGTDPVSPRERRVSELCTGLNTAPGGWLPCWPAPGPQTVGTESVEPHWGSAEARLSIDLQHGH